jgi:hypothetical protein
MRLTIVDGCTTGTLYQIHQYGNGVDVHDSRPWKPASDGQAKM